MATVIIYNNDVQGALRALKKEQQKEGTFRYIKAKKTFKNNREKALERETEIVRRKIKDKNEKISNGFYNQISVQSSKPFVFKLYGRIIKVFNDGRVGVYTSKNKKVNEIMLDVVDFDDQEKLINAVKETIKG